MKLSSRPFPGSKAARRAFLLAAALLAAPAGASAQGYYPPGSLPDGGGTQAQPSDASQLVRIDRLEAQMRQLNGEIEQLQFQNRRLEEQLRKFQQDVDFRFQEGGRGAGAPAAPAASPAKPQKRGDAIDDILGQDEQTAAAPEPEPSVGRTVAGRRSDAFDPDADPTAPGAPRPLGSPASAAPEPRGRAATAEDFPSNGPLDLSGAKWRQPDPDPAAQSAAAAQSPAPAPNPVKDEYDLAFGYFRQKQYEAAEKGFSGFLQKNPKSRYAADATYYLGESFFQRGRQREAAEQFLKFSTQFTGSPRAPEAMLRLGQSLNALGAKEQGCATFAELSRKYPNASASVKAGVERELKRAQC
ncbi:tol-pal system protein YbgF [Methylocella sp.]|uniref:tol-pal system protein YbgF n=1 Tax=Methylocella sp. TaxID=1978226 RepID=UPI0035B4ECA5